MHKIGTFAGMRLSGLASSLQTRPQLWVLAAAGLTYGLTRSPYLGFGDSIGFALQAVTGFDLATNATSHLLYAVLNRLLVLALPGADPALILTAGAGVFALLALERVYRLCRHCGLPAGSSAVAVLIFGLGFTWWRQAVQAEVYAFSTWLACGFLAAAACNLRDGRTALRMSAWLGLALLAHIQYVLLLPAWLYALLRPGTGWRQPALAGLALAGISAPLWVLPLALHTHPLRAVLFDHQFQGQVLAFSAGQLLRGAALSAGYLVYNFHLWLLPAAAGTVRLWQRQRRAWLLLLLAGGPLWAFAMRYAVTDSYVFFILPYAALTPALAAGLERACADGKRTLLLAGAAWVLAPLLYAGAWQAAERLPRAAAFAAPKAYKGGLRYYLWPGLERAPDPLQLAKDIEAGRTAPIADFDRYPAALELSRR
ncbi:MAG: DUF2723 domain-containing protein [Bacteroidia bacterium]|nr:DUF2723 domain-containing protein [Bacteroidia bacterium]